MNNMIEEMLKVKAELQKVRPSVVDVFVVARKYWDNLKPLSTDPCAASGPSSMYYAGRLDGIPVLLAEDKEEAQKLIKAETEKGHKVILCGFDTNPLWDDFVGPTVSRPADSLFLTQGDMDRIQKELLIKDLETENMKALTKRLEQGFNLGPF